MKNEYDDIINLQRHISKKRPPMPIKDRAAQFSPFAALTGHDTAVKETARLTEKRVDLSQYMKDVLNRRLHILGKKIEENPEIKITYFIPDENKDGGSYTTVTGVVKKIDEYKQIILMMDDREINIEEITTIEGHIFDNIKRNL